MKKLLAVMFACAMAACMSEDETSEVDDAVMDDETAAEVALAIEASKRMEIEPASASCGRAGPNRENRRVNDAASPNAANQRSGSSTGCPALGVLQPSDDAIYYCYTLAGNFTWTYLQSVRTGVRGWVRDDLLRLNSDGTRGSIEWCGF